MITTKTILSKSFWCLHKQFNDKHNICSANRTNPKMFRALCFTRRQHKHQIVDFIDTCSKNYALVQKYKLRTVEQQTHHHCSALVYQFLFSQKKTQNRQNLEQLRWSTSLNHVIHNSQPLTTSTSWHETKFYKSHSKSIKSWVCFLSINNPTDKNNNLLETLEIQVDVSPDFGSLHKKRQSKSEYEFETQKKES